MLGLGRRTVEAVAEQLGDLRLKIAYWKVDQDLKETFLKNARGPIAQFNAPTDDAVGGDVTHAAERLGNTTGQGLSKETFVERGSQIGQTSGGNEAGECVQHGQVLKIRSFR